MTRQEIKRWAEETVNRIFHGNTPEQTFKGEVSAISDTEKTGVVFHISESLAHFGKVDMRLSSYFPLLDKAFKPGDMVEITIRKV